MNKHRKMRGNTVIEYIVIMMVFVVITSEFLPGILQDLEAHHDNYANTLSVP